MARLQFQFDEPIKNNIPENFALLFAVDVVSWYCDRKYTQPY